MNLKEQIENYKPYNEQEEKDRELMLKYFETYDDVLTRENEAVHFTASSWIVNRQRTKVIMIYHNIYDSWAWTGGHADGDSDLAHVALKEAKEETGLENVRLLYPNIFGLEILTVDGHVKRGKYVGSHLHLNCTFLLEADERDMLRIKEDENKDVRWFDLDETINVTKEPKMVPIYTKLNKRLRKMLEDFKIGSSINVSYC